MRRTLSMLAAVALLGLAACEGPEGPAGPPGPKGDTGDQGVPGLDAVASCTQCHTDDTELFARQVQYYNSTHYNGGNFERASLAYNPDEPNGCAPCHAHEGFIEVLSTGEQETEASFENPSPINCRTCHMIHTNYDDSDYMLRTTQAVDLWNTEEGTVDFGTGNLCANCHQGRVLSPRPVIDGADVAITSSRYGYHHGPQAQVLGAVGGFPFDGTLTIPDAPGAHGTPTINAGGCVSCHMAAGFGNQSGGHTWTLAYIYHDEKEELLTGCVGCHPSATTFDIGGVQTKVHADLDSLAVLLKAIGVMSSSGSSVKGTWPANVAAAFVNWQMVEEDRSAGVHHPQFVQSLLKNTIEEMEPLVP